MSKTAVKSPPHPVHPLILDIISTSLDNHLILTLPHKATINAKNNAKKTAKNLIFGVDKGF